MENTNQNQAMNQVQTNINKNSIKLDKVGKIILIITAIVTAVFITLGCVFVGVDRPNGTRNKPYVLPERYYKVYNSNFSYTYISFQPTLSRDYYIYVNDGYIKEVVNEVGSTKTLYNSSSSGYDDSKRVYLSANEKYIIKINTTQKTFGIIVDIY